MLQQKQLAILVLIAVFMAVGGHFLLQLFVIHSESLNKYFHTPSNDLWCILENIEEMTALLSTRKGYFLEIAFFSFTNYLFTSVRFLCLNGYRLKPIHKHASGSFSLASTPSCIKKGLTSWSDFMDNSVRTRTCIFLAGTH